MLEKGEKQWKKIDGKGKVEMRGMGSLGTRKKIAVVEKRHDMTLQ